MLERRAGEAKVRVARVGDILVRVLGVLRRMDVLGMWEVNDNQKGEGELKCNLKRERSQPIRRSKTFLMQGSKRSLLIDFLLPLDETLAFDAARNYSQFWDR